MRRIPLVLTTLLLFTLTAHADPKSWTAVKGKLPADTQIVVGIDVKQIAKTSIYTAMLDQFLAEERDAKAGFDMIKAGCGIDVTTSITDVTVYGTIEPKDKALIVLGLDGVDQPKAEACLQKIAESSGQGAKITAKKKGKVTEYSVTGEDKKFYAAWLAKDVVAITDEPFEKGRLEKLLAGKAPRGDLKAFLGKITATSPVFVAVAKKEKAADLGGTVKGGYGTIELASGNVSGAAHVVMSTADEAATLAKMATAELQKAQPDVAKQMPDLAKVMAGITIGAAGSEVTISGSIAEKLLGTIIPQLDKIF